MYLRPIRQVPRGVLSTKIFSQEEVVPVSLGNVHTRKRKNCMIYVNNILRHCESRKCLAYGKVTKSSSDVITFYLIYKFRLIWLPLCI